MHVRIQPVTTGKSFTSLTLAAPKVNLTEGGRRGKCLFSLAGLHEITDLCKRNQKGPVGALHLLLSPISPPWPAPSPGFQSCACGLDLDGEKEGREEPNKTRTHPKSPRKGALCAQEHAVFTRAREAGRVCARTPCEYQLPPSTSRCLHCVPGPLGLLFCTKRPGCPADDTTTFDCPKLVGTCQEAGTDEL